MKQKWYHFEKILITGCTGSYHFDNFHCSQWWKINQNDIYSSVHLLTHWGRVTHKCVGNSTIISSDNGLAPGWCQTIIRTNAGILLIGPLGKKIQWNFNRNLYIFNKEDTFENVVWKLAAILSRPQCVKPTSIVAAGPGDTQHIFIKWGIVITVYQRIIGITFSWYLPVSCTFPNNLMAVQN